MESYKQKTTLNESTNSSKNNKQDEHIWLESESSIIKKTSSVALEIEEKGEFFHDEEEIEQELSDDIFNSLSFSFHNEIMSLREQNVKNGLKNNEILFKISGFLSINDRISLKYVNQDIFKVIFYIY